MTHEIKIVNVSTGEEIVRDATAAETQVIEADAAASIAAKAAAEAKEASKEAVLAKLGLTADEVTALLA